VVLDVGWTSRMTDVSLYLSNITASGNSAEGVQMSAIRSIGPMLRCPFALADRRLAAIY
jgi:hypothetical protein